MQHNSLNTLDLGGLWQVESSCGAWKFDMTVPGSIFAELEKLGAFGSEGAFWRENNRLCQDMAERDFTLTRAFELPVDFALPASSGDSASGNFWLECDGLDTLAEIRVNGALVGTADNMHRVWRYSVGQALRAGRNEISVKLANTLAYCREKAAKRPLWQTYENNPELAAPHFNQIRKSHCSYGWDWGPVVPDAGIWKDIRIAAYGDWRLDSVSVLQHHGPDGSVTLELSPELLPGSAGKQRLAALSPADLYAEALAAGFTLSGKLTHPDGAIQLFSFRRVENLAADAGSPTASSVTVPVTDPKLWWPAGLGEQPLYELTVTLSAPDGTEIGQKTIRLGLRTLTVRQEGDQWGETFEFACNGVSFFARGANYIPEDIFLSRVSPERTRQLLNDCALANFNAVRVWGGGVYPSDVFFDACDELGLVVWQDLMFACAVYDVNSPDFMANITAEVRDNVRRFRHHPSLGLVCGNNEMEIALVAWGIPHTLGQKAEYIEQYEVRFPEILKREAPQTFYWPASPSTTGSFDDPNAPDKGDCHYWDVWHGYKDFHDFTRHYFRFMSEFGFESYPDLKTVESFTLPEDRVQGSPVLEDHQRCVLGTVKLAGYLARYFRSPKDFASLVLVSQINQAEAIRTGIEHWRRNRGRCMGSIYWQLNDNWPVNSWSSLDSAGRWKLLHYAVKRAYAPILASVEALMPKPAKTHDAAQSSDTSGTAGTSDSVPAAPVKPAAAGNPGAGAHGDHPPAESPRIALHLSNENPCGVSAVLEWRLVLTDGSELDAGSVKVELPGFTSRAAVELDYTEKLGVKQPERRVTPIRNALLFYRWTAQAAAEALAAGASQTGPSPVKVGPVSCHAFAPWKSVDLEPAKVAIAVGRDASGQRTVTLRSDKPALFATVSNSECDLVMSDNGVPLDGKTERTLTVLRGGDKLDDAAFAAGLSVTHLKNTY